ncbi:hypothetical protein [Georgenia alba]|uniref:DUF4386 family protein n=1 Tax=Georgenia alba TaxID=2233858 RepID=A0ABW2QDP3_9MICO
MSSPPGSPYQPYAAASWGSANASSPWGSGGTNDAANRLALAAAVVLAALELVTVAHHLLWNAGAASAFGLATPWWVLAMTAVWAVAAFGAAAAATRSGSLALAAGAIGGLNLLLLLVLVVARPGLGAEETLPREAFEGLVVMVAALVAATMAYLGHRRDRAGRASAAFAVIGVGVPLAAAVVTDVVRMSQGVGASFMGPWVLLAHLYTVVWFGAILLVGLRARATRWMAVAACVVGLLRGSVYVIEWVIGEVSGTSLQLMTDALYPLGWLVALVLAVLAARRTRNTGRL